MKFCRYSMKSYIMEKTKKQRIAIYIAYTFAALALIFTIILNCFRYKGFIYFLSLLIIIIAFVLIIFPIYKPKGILIYVPSGTKINMTSNEYVTVKRYHGAIFKDKNLTKIVGDWYLFSFKSDIVDYLPYSKDLKILFDAEEYEEIFKEYLQ